MFFIAYSNLDRILISFVSFRVNKIKYLQKKYNTCFLLKYQNELKQIQRTQANFELFIEQNELLLPEVFSFKTYWS